MFVILTSVDVTFSIR